MKKVVLKYVLAMGLTGTTFLACGGGEGGGSTTSPTPDFTVAPLVSDCGGFVAGGTGAKIPPPDPKTYCDAERLLWNYDAASKTLGVTNSRIVLNCCGTHSVTVDRDGDTVVFTEIDGPKDGTRCKCECVFDFAADVSTLEPGMTSLRIVRNVTDSQMPPKVVWEGTLDLSAGMGEVIINTEPTSWCMPPAP